MKKRKSKHKRKPTHCMMVIRVAVPIKMAPRLKVSTVLGRTSPMAYDQSLQILNAYYDLKDKPTAL